MSLQDQILISVITALITAGLAYLGFWRQAKAELKKEYESRFNEKKWEVYLKFTNLLQLIPEYQSLHKIEIYDMTTRDSERYHELRTTFTSLQNEIESAILLIGSKSVVRSFLLWKNLPLDIDINNEPYVIILVKLINDMRQDLGQEKTEFTAKDFDGNYYRSKELNEATLKLLNQKLMYHSFCKF